MIGRITDGVELKNPLQPGSILGHAIFTPTSIPCPFCADGLHHVTDTRERGLPISRVVKTLSPFRHGSQRAMMSDYPDGTVLLCCRSCRILFSQVEKP